MNLMGAFRGLDTYAKTLTEAGPFQNSSVGASHSGVYLLSVHGPGSWSDAVEPGVRVSRPRSFICLMWHGYEPCLSSRPIATYWVLALSRCAPPKVVAIPRHLAETYYQPI